MEAGASAEASTVPAVKVDQEKAEAEAYLQSLINKTLRVYTTDARLFVGTFKCTDPVGSPRGFSGMKTVAHILLAKQHCSLTHS